MQVHFTKHWQIQNEYEQFTNDRALILTADNSGISHAITLWSYSFTVLVDKKFLGYPAVVQAGLWELSSRVLLQ